MQKNCSLFVDTIFSVDEKNVFFVRFITYFIDKENVMYTLNSAVHKGVGSTNLLSRLIGVGCK